MDAAISIASDFIPKKRKLHKFRSQQNTRYRSLIEFQVTALDSGKTEKSVLKQITTHFNISPPVFCKVHLTKQVLNFSLSTEKGTSCHVLPLQR